MSKSVVCILIVCSSVCLANFVVYSSGVGTSYHSAYSLKALIPPSNKIFILTTNWSSCSSDKVIISNSSFSPMSREILSLPCSGVLFPDREIYYGAASTSAYSELLDLFSRRFIVLSSGSIVSEVRNLVINRTSRCQRWQIMCNRSLNESDLEDEQTLNTSGMSINCSEAWTNECSDIQIQFGYTIYSPWFGNQLTKYTVRILIAGFFWILGYYSRIYDVGFRDAGKFIITKFTISSILHFLFIIIWILAICFIVDPLFIDGMFSPNIGVLIAVASLGLPASCLFMMALFWRDTVDEIFEFNYMSRYGSLFLLIFSCLSGFMMIFILAGAFIDNLKNFYPYIGIVHIVMLIISSISLIVYDVWIFIIFKKMRELNRLQIYPIITQVLVNIGMILRIIGALIFISRLTEVGIYSGLWNPIHFLFLRIGEFITYYALARQLGDFVTSKQIKNSKTSSKSSKNVKNR